jgi:Spy/CpxP family protein refolding chaperone
MELAQAILADKSDSPRVQSAIAKIHDAQGELQQATMRHVFEMKPVLAPEQYEKLLNLTANALYEVGHAK